MQSNWTQGLNAEQSAAVLHTQGPLLILAGAGSGKTTVLVSRTGQLVQHEQISPDRICVLTFTTKAARELKERVTHRVGRRARDLWTGTFHSFGLSILRHYQKHSGLPPGFGVIDQSDSHAILKELLMNTKDVGKDAFKVEKLASLINDLRQNGRTALQNESDDYETMAHALLPKYLKRLEILGVTDFEGLLIKPLQLFAKHPEILADMQARFEHVMVDEFQDTNAVQFRLVQSLVEKHQNIAVVGDDDQSIYGWRGAMVSNILDFPKYFKKCRVIRLERNYRSTPAILNVANQVIAKNEARFGKTLKADPKAAIGDSPEIFVYDNDDIESEEVAAHIRYFIDQGFEHRDMAVLYRSNGQGGMIEAQLRKAQIPYSITGGTGLFDRKESKDVLAYLRCALNPNEIAFRRILNVPVRGIGDTSIERIEQRAREKGLKFHLAARQWAEAGVPEKSGQSVDAFLQVLERFADRILSTEGGRTVGEQLVSHMRELGYRDSIAQTCKQPQALESRWAVVEIIGRILDTFVERGARDRRTLIKFLDAMELRDVADDSESDRESKVQLLTLHACKGLEFPVVIFVGCEEELIPHRTLGSDVAEERRLFYVGLTRAKKNLVLTRARTRKRFGKWQPSAPSRFLLEIPGNMVTVFESGIRPLNETQRKDMLANLFAKLDKKAEASAEK